MKYATARLLEKGHIPWIGIKAAFTVVTLAVAETYNAIMSIK